MAKISEQFEGTVFIPGHGSFGAGDELPDGVEVGSHVALASKPAPAKAANTK